MRVFAAIAFASLLLIPLPGHAQNTNDPTIEACRTTGLIALDFKELLTGYGNEPQ